MRLVLHWSGAGLAPMIAKLDAAGDGRARVALTQIVGEIGRTAHQDILAPLEAQTGLHGNTRIQRAVKDEAGGLSWSLVTRGGNISLKYFGAHEGGGGVTASPRDTPTFYGGAFTKSGQPGQRAFVGKLNKQVFRNGAGGAWGGKISRVRSGVTIPDEMVRGKTAQTFGQSVERGFAKRLPTILTILG